MSFFYVAACPRNHVTIDAGFWNGWRDFIGETTLAHQFEELRADGQFGIFAHSDPTIRQAHTGKPTLLSLSNHTYWNLNIRLPTFGPAKRRCWGRKRLEMPQKPKPIFP